MTNKITRGGRSLRRAYSVQFVQGRWVVGVGGFWPGKRMTIFDARTEARKRNRQTNAKK